MILAGGLATRMGGRDKGMLPLGRATVLDRIIARMSPQCSQLAINANGDPDRLLTYGLPVVADSVTDYPGPLAGILAAMDWGARLDARWVVTAAADTPFPPPDLVAGLQNAANDAGAAIALAASPDGEGILRNHPIFGLWSVTLRDDLRNDLTAGLRKVSMWAGKHHPAIAAFASDPYDPFFNVNTPDDLERAAAIAARWP